jgi:hypothetical protein
VTQFLNHGTVCSRSTPRRLRIAFELLVALSLSFNPAFAMNGGEQACFSADECQGNFPAAVQFGNADGDCSATKVGPRLFITAAHCKREGVLNDPSNISISGLKRNTQELSTEFCEKLAQEFPKSETVESCLEKNYLKYYMNVTIVKWEVHPLYDATSSNFHGDVALFEIDQDTPETPVAELCSREMTSGETVFATGYGKRTDLLDQSQGYAVVLKYAQLPVQDVLPEAGVFETAGKGGLLLDDPNGVSLLLGDSGSGVYALEDGKKCLAGINSNGQRYPFHRFFYVHYHTDLTPSERFGIRQWLLPLLKSQ